MKKTGECLGGLCVFPHACSHWVIQTCFSSAAHACSLTVHTFDQSA